MLLAREIEEAIKPFQPPFAYPDPPPSRRLEYLLEELLVSAFSCAKAGGDLFTFMQTRGLNVDEQYVRDLETNFELRMSHHFGS